MSLKNIETPFERGTWLDAAYVTFVWWPFQSSWWCKGFIWGGIAMIILGFAL